MLGYNTFVGKYICIFVELDPTNMISSLVTEGRIIVYIIIFNF